MIVCPRCRTRLPVVVAAKRGDGALVIAKLVCRSEKCGRRVVYDVRGRIAGRN